MSITVKHTKVSLIPDSGDDSLIEPSDWNDDHALTGIGTMAEQDADSVAITGGTISGATVSGYIPTTEKGANNGVATLDANGKVPTTQIPMQGDLNYQGTWNASTNTPTLTSSTGTKGYYYVVDVAGTTNLDGITDWQIGDWAIYNGTIWQKVDNTDAVSSVNGQTGTVVLTTTDIGEGTNLYYTDARARASNSAGTGISYDSATGVITNSAPDQTVSLTGAGTTSISGTYPNFTITSNDEFDGDVVGPASATDNAIARYDSTTGKLIQNSVVIVDDTGSVTGVNALTAQSLTVNNNATLGSSNTDTLEVKSRITSDLDPNTNNANDIGSSGRNWRDGFFGRTLHTVNLELTGTTSFDGSQGTSGQVLTSAGTGNTPTWTTPTVGTVTSVDATGGTGISVSGGPITSSGSLTITNTAPDQVVSLTGAGTTSISGTYPNFTITSDDQFDGTVTSVGGTGTVNGLTLTGTVTSSGNLTLGGTLDLSAPPVIGGTTPNTITGTTINANTKVVSPDYYAQSILGGNLRTSGGTSLLNWDGGGSGVITVNGGLSANPSNKNISLAPTGTGTVTINPATAGTMDNVAIGGTTPASVAGTVIQATNGIVINSNTVSASYTIPAGSSGMSAGPMTVASGQTVTVSSGSRWVIL
jgi:hypothetical protein